MELLDKSQTFIGVLATIVVLCIIGDSSFICNIFSGIINSTEEKINDLKEHLISISSEIRQSAEFAKFKSEVDNLVDKYNLSQASIKALNSKIEYELRINAYTNKYSSLYFLPIYKKIDEIKDSQEQTLVPLYIFAYCILVFISDEICRWQPLFGDVIIGMLSFSMLVSTVFILFLWIKFLKECNPKKWLNNIKPNTPTQNRVGITNRMKNCIKRFFICIFIFCISWLIAILCHTLFPNVSCKILWWSIVLFNLIVFIIIGYRHHSISPHFGQYRHSFLLIHFVLIILLSLCFSILFLPSIHGHDIRLTYENLYLLRFIIGCFIIIIGIVFPFLFLYIANRNVYHFAKKWCNKGEDEARTSGNQLKKELAIVLKDINIEISLERDKKYEFELLGTDSDIIAIKNIRITDS